uniref:Uncharacterized protein n=1 Tax=Arundo donax TaxID=35708 RepID=A0A0A9BZ38_ARUDO
MVCTNQGHGAPIWAILYHRAQSCHTTLAVRAGAHRTTEKNRPRLASLHSLSTCFHSSMVNSLRSN